MKGSTIIDAVRSVTKRWTKQRRAEERKAARASRRREALVRSERVTVKDAAWSVMEDAYMKASSGNTLPAHARQIMYAARGEIQRLTDTILNDQYFCQTLLPDYLMAHPDKVSDWDVVFDARGHLEEPHTGESVPLGTLDVREYLERENRYVQEEPAESVSGTALFPTVGPDNRFGAILFIEKEGFLPLLKAVKLAERYDVAIMSTKGMSVTAGRLLVDRICMRRSGGVPLLVLHDLDKAGFSILGTLSRNTRRFAFTNDVDVIDLGLRLADVKEHGLEAEDVHYGRSDPRENLEENGATEEEITFLCGSRDWQGYHGRRVELNAFASADFVRWIESKLKALGVEKVVPPRDTLERAYRRAVERSLVEERLEEIQDAARSLAAKAKVPRDLVRRVEARLRRDRGIPWDVAVGGEATRRAKASPPKRRRGGKRRA